MKNYLFLLIPGMLFLGCDKDDETAEVLEEASALQEEHCVVCSELTALAAYYECAEDDDCEESELYPEWEGVNLYSDTVCDNSLAIDAYVGNWESQEPQWLQYQNQYWAECLEINAWENIQHNASINGYDSESDNSLWDQVSETFSQTDSLEMVEFMEEWEDQEPQYCAECLEYTYVYTTDDADPVVNSGLYIETVCADDDEAMEKYGTIELYVEAMETLDPDDPDPEGYFECEIYLQEFDCHEMYMQDFYCETYLNE